MSAAGLPPLFPESQRQCLRSSLLDLAALCKDLKFEGGLVTSLQELSTELRVSEGYQTRPPNDQEAQYLLAQARASFDLLTKIGVLSEKDSGLEEQVGKALDDLETALGQEMRKAPSERVHGLYVIVDPEVTGGRDPLEIAEAALRGGAKMLQLRDKDREKGQSILLAKALNRLCQEFGALFIMNDHADVAVLAGADGIHVGQGDLSVEETRRVISPSQLVGRSNYTLEESLESQRMGADYVALGNIYSTSTKASIRDRAPLGPATLAQVKEVLDVPLVAIGGIDETNIAQVAAAGADAICVSSAVGTSKDPEKAARALVQAIAGAGRNT